MRRIDRDVRPIFRPTNSHLGGLVNEYPFVGQGWSDNQLGDLWLGGKVNLLSEWKQKPMAFAVRGMVKLPTAKDTDEGVGTGKADFAVRCDREQGDQPARRALGLRRVHRAGRPERRRSVGRLPLGLRCRVPDAPQPAADGRAPRRIAARRRDLHRRRWPPGGRGRIDFRHSYPTRIRRRTSRWASRGSASKGFFAGAGANWRFGMDGRSAADPSFDDRSGDSFGFQARIGYHPGVRVYTPPPPPPPPPPPAPTAKPDHVLGVKASCNPCTVEVGRQSTVSSVATSSIGCTVTYSWSAPTGTLTNRTAQNTPWTAPNTEGTVPVTITVTCPQDGKTASDTVNINVIRPVVKQIVFEDVHFDFDRYSLRPEATRALDEAITAMQQNASLRIQIEGHTCNIGTAEYNLALGDRRANSVRDYLTSRGIAASRLGTVSYGEERPKHDNAREETRRLNRRAALVVNLQQQP